MSEEKQEIRAKIDALRAELAERRRAVPAHTIRPHQLLRLEELEEEIAALEARLKGD